jgi:L-ascorbate metabolism protein UlaG (beta-lactamase superfamily)
MPSLTTIPFEQPLAEKLAKRPSPGISLYWLGQAGFVIDANGTRIVIDPYLSDTLESKYRDTPYSHRRMAPAPVTPDQLGPVDLVLCTHHHTDHMDGETLKALAQRLPDLKFVVPAASAELARQRIGVADIRLIKVDAGNDIQMAGLYLHVMRAAHEALEQDESGHHRFLGYGMDFGNARIFHSGDTIPFEGQEEEISAFGPDLALLPVNGRSAALKAAGFAGNFTLAEAVTLCESCAINTMFAHHYGMFAFNTIAPEDIDRAAAETQVQLVRAVYNREFRLDAA